MRRCRKNLFTGKVEFHRAETHKVESVAVEDNVFSNWCLSLMERNSDC